jgi:phosphatidylinositol dimannoside acyltransferase
VRLNGNAVPIAERFRRALRKDSLFWRRALQAGVHYGPEAFVRYSPPAFGVAFAAALHRERAAVRRTLERVLGRRPPLEELRHVAAVFANFASSLTDAMLVGMGRGFVATHRPVNDWYFLSSAARGKGVILATAQTSGWDVAGTFLSADQAREVWVVMERERNQRAREVHDRARRRAGVRIVHIGDDPLDALPLLGHLRHGGVLALKFDRVHHGIRTRRVSFLGGDWRVPEGPLTLAALSGAPLVPVFTRRIGFLEYQVINCEPIELPRRPSNAQLDAAAQRLADRLEEFVRAHPTQWFHFGDD